MVCSCVAVSDWGAVDQREEIEVLPAGLPCQSKLLIPVLGLLLLSFIVSSLCLTAFIISVTSASTASYALSWSCVVSIFVPCGVIVGIGKWPLFLIILSSFSMANSFITSSTCHKMSEMYNLYTLNAVTALSCESSDFLY